jgi:hypothetical protein
MNIKCNGEKSAYDWSHIEWGVGQFGHLAQASCLERGPIYFIYFKIIARKQESGNYV